MNVPLDICARIPAHQSAISTQPDPCLTMRLSTLFFQLDEFNRAKLTDMGLCKPEGLVSHSLVGTPINMAPEMIQQQYDKTVDVYAFGMLLWRVCEGKGNQPQNVNKHFLPLVMLMLNALENKTPERLDAFPQSCWELMEMCWTQDPQKRPSFDTIVKELEEFLRDGHVE